MKNEPKLITKCAIRTTTLENFFHFYSLYGTCTKIKKKTLEKFGDRGGTVVKVLCYKSEGRWYDSRWCHSNFSLT